MSAQVDPLIPQAREAILAKGEASVSHLQRTLRVNYLRAMDLMRALEGDVVTAPDHNGHRRMLDR